MNEIEVCVYLDNINHQYNGEDNLAHIMIPTDLFQKWWDLYCNPRSYFDAEEFEYFLEVYTADDTDGLYSWLLNEGYNPTWYKC